ncbi:MAG: outer membrane lipoprotein-sorting protein [Bacteroidales bacterium]|nr:outer membrane lipoprotein-sorting protein [Bacteroidales bacterium]
MKKLAFSLLLAMLPFMLPAQSLTATEIVRKADEKYNGEKSSYSVMSMTIVRPGWKRTLEFKNWTLGREYALTLITVPAKEAGQSFLKRQNEMWSWNPAISRLIKLPPSMMSQGWMGSDYTNDDILRESSLVKDYTHKLLGEETLGGRLCYKILMTAREEAAIVWGKQIRWIDKKEFLVMKAELYDEDGYLVRTETGSGIKAMDGRTITTLIELVPEDEPDNKTMLEIKEIRFNQPVEESFFSQQNMKKVR